jgi:hypothetical protein
MSFRDVLEKFVVFDKKEADPSAEKALAPVAPSAGPPSTAPPSSSTERPDGDFDLSVIYRRAGIPVAPFTAEQALETLASLPKEFGAETLRQGLKDLLHAKSVTPESVVEDAKRKLETVKSLPGQFAEFITTSESDIARLQEQIDEKHKAIEQAQRQQHELDQKCQLETERLAKLLELLG